MKYEIRPFHVVVLRFWRSRCRGRCRILRPLATRRTTRPESYATSKFLLSIAYNKASQKAKSGEIFHAVKLLKTKPCTANAKNKLQNPLSLDFSCQTIHKGQGGKNGEGGGGWGSEHELFLCSLFKDLDPLFFARLVWLTESLELAIFFPMKTLLKLPGLKRHRD